HEVGGVLAVGTALVQPQARARDPVNEDLHGPGPRLDDVLPRHDDAGHVVGPVLAGVEEDPAEPAELRLRRVRLAPPERADRARPTEQRPIGPAARAPATSGGAISIIRTSAPERPFCSRALKTISRSSEKRLGIAIVLPFRSRTEWTGPSFATTTALPYRCPRY